MQSKISRKSVKLLSCPLVQTLDRKHRFFYPRSVQTVFCRKCVLNTGCDRCGICLLILPAVKKSDLAIQFGCPPEGHSDWIKGGVFRSWFTRACGIWERETHTPLSHMQQSLTQLKGLTVLTFLYELYRTYFISHLSLAHYDRDMLESWNLDKLRTCHFKFIQLDKWIF